MQTRLIRPLVRLILTVIGLALVAAAFFGVMYWGTVNNRPGSRVVMAYRDIAVGERLKPENLKVAELQLDPGLARLYVQESELDQYQNATVMDVLRRGDPLSKSKLNSTGDLASGAGRERYATILENPTDVILTLPVAPDYIPSRVTSGDTVNILLVAGTDINQLPKSREPATAGQEPLSLAATATPTPRPGATPQPSPTPQLALPLADVMLERVPSLDVNYKQIQNPAAGPDRPNEPAYIDGEITSIVVRVPGSHQTILSFGASTNRLRYALVSPNLKDADVRPQLGVSWNSYVDLWDWKQKESAARGETLQGILYPHYTPVAPTATVLVRAADIGAQATDIATPTLKAARP